MQRIAIGVSVLVLAVTATIVVEGFRGGRSEPARVAAQDPRYLDQKISSLEQRLIILESTVRSLQQQPIVPAGSPTRSSQPERNPDTELLRAELEILKSRLKEVHCGVEHLDERTLSAAAREAQKRGGRSQDPCRQFSDAPVQLTPFR